VLGKSRLRDGAGRRHLQAVMTAFLRERET
jgi:hypothetical protein